MVGETAPTLNLDHEFEGIIQANYGTGGNTGADVVAPRPFGLFTENELGLAGLVEDCKRAMTTGTGYTGNNGEESC